MADRLGVELARVGTFDLQEGGRQTFTPAMLTSAAAKTGRVPVKLGHLAAALNDGAPAFGWVKNLRTEGDGDGTVLLGDITDIPTWLDESADWAYPHRSIEGSVRAANDSGERDLEVTGLALLGATPPGMPTIASWRDLPKALAAAASAGAAGDLSLTEFRAAFEALAPLADSPAAQTPAGPPDSNTPPTNPKEADTMSDTLIKGLRERFGFAEDADESAILAAVDGARDPEITPEKAAEVLAAAGKTVVSDALLTTLKVQAAEGAEARKKQREDERETAIAAAQGVGKLGRSDEEVTAWRKAWDRDPVSTAKELDELGVRFPVAAAAGYAGHDGSAGDAVTYTDDMASEDAELFGLPKEAFSR